MATKALTDRTLQALKPKGRRYDVRDADCAGLVVRVSETGSRHFTLQARFPGGGGKATRRTLGSVSRHDPAGGAQTCARLAATD